MPPDSTPDSTPETQPKPSKPIRPIKPASLSEDEWQLTRTGMSLAQAKAQLNAKNKPKT